MFCFRVPKQQFFIFSQCNFLFFRRKRIQFYLSVPENDRSDDALPLPVQINLRLQRQPDQAVPQIRSDLNRAADLQIRQHFADHSSRLLQRIMEKAAAFILVFPEHPDQFPLGILCLNQVSSGHNPGTVFRQRCKIRRHPGRCIQSPGTEIQPEL